MFVASAGFLLNIAEILVIIVDPCKIFHKGPWLTVLNLAAADLISCISFSSIYGDSFFLNYYHEIYYAIVFFSWMFGVSASFLMLTFLTLQTFLAIKFPFQSRNWLTRCKIISICTLLWVFSFLLGLGDISWLRFQGNLTFKIYVGELGILLCAIIIQVILNIQITIEIRRSRPITGNATKNRHRNIAKTVIILTVILYLTAFPYFMLRQLRYLVRLGIFGQDKTAGKLYAIAYLYQPIAMLNFVVNPVLYAFRLDVFKKSLLVCVRKLRCFLAGTE